MGIVVLIIVAFVMGLIVGLMLGFSRTMREVARRVTAVNDAIMGKVFIGVGLVALLGAVGTACSTWFFVRGAQRTLGTVIELQQSTDNESDRVTYAPVVGFQDANGFQHTVASRVYSAPPKFRVGDTVPVLYRPEAPDRARLARYWDLWGLPTVLGMLGCGQVIAGIIFAAQAHTSARSIREKPDAPSA
jgi:hypothetical protein